MSGRSPISFAPDAYRVGELRRAGISRSRLDATDIRRVARGIVLHPDSDLDPQNYIDRCIAVGQSLKKEFFISRRSAATVLEVPCPIPPEGRIEVGSFSPLRAPRCASIVGHRVKSGVLSWTTRRGIEIPSPSDVWCQLAGVLTLPALVAAGDFLISGKRIPNGGGTREAPLATREELSAALDRHARSAGSALRSRALPLLRRPVDSPPESELRLIIVAAGFAEPVVNCPVPVRDRVLRADLGFPELRIAIEYEGAYHFEGPDQPRRDAERWERMFAAGWRVLRVMSADLQRPEEFLHRLAGAVQAARDTPPQRTPH